VPYFKAKFTVNCLIIVNESPWQTGLALNALRFARAAAAAGLQVSAVFFREDGVYQALPSTEADSGTPELAKSWQGFAEQSGARLLLCSASSQRRLPKGSNGQAFQQTGLAEMLELMQQSDRVVSF
jgi:tRNA 2-thiouridine synthesizing protein D